MNLGRDFNWLWGAFAVSTFGSAIAYDALPLIAILALRAGPAAGALMLATPMLLPRRAAR